MMILEPRSALRASDRAVARGMGIRAGCRSRAHWIPDCGVARRVVIRSAPGAARPGVRGGRGEDRSDRIRGEAVGEVRIYAQGAMESEAVFASEWLFSRAGARISILWDDP